MNIKYVKDGDLSVMTINDHETIKKTGEALLIDIELPDGWSGAQATNAVDFVLSTFDKFESLGGE